MRALDEYRKRRRRAAARRLVASGNAARDARRWAAAAKAYGNALRIEPGRAPIHVQHGHALKEAGDRESARDAYERALAIDSRNWDSWVQLGHVLKLLGRSEDAIAAYREASILAPEASSPRAELIAMGARDAIPDEAAWVEFDAALSATNEAARTLERTVREARELSSDPHRSYDDFRQAYPILPPPADLDHASTPMSILVEGRNALAAEIRCTLDSLLDQTSRTWRATILVTDAMAGHPVASMAAVDRRIAFATEACQAPAPGARLRVRAGTILDPRAIEWFRFAATLASPAAAYCDHDHAEQDWRGHRRHFDPVLQPRFDPFWFEGGQSSPALIYVADAHSDLVDRDDDNGRILCRIASAGGRVVHVPRLLATIIDVKATVAAAPPDAVSPAPASAAPPRRAEGGASAANAAIVVVIPTRDQAELLERCIATLMDRARFPDRLEIIVVDNRSVEGETATLLARLARAHNVRVLPLDEPFNWSRANNLAIKSSDAPLLALLNNDTEMLTYGWDEILSGHLARRGVGILGAKLLYPDRTVQHAGILFGMNDAPPAHEGVGAAEGDPGPDGRWVRLRSAAAVTGAFMGMRRQTWDMAGGFDELALPLGYNDVDMCLRVRASGDRILYAPDLLLIHHESKTRGHNVTRSQVAWDLAELRALYTRWGDVLLEDPSLNPHWIRHGTAFGGYREPTTSEIVRQIEG